MPLTCVTDMRRWATVRQSSGQTKSRPLDERDAEHDDLRGALPCLIEQGDMVRARQLGVPLGRFWFFPGHLAEGRAWFARLLTRCGPRRRTILRCAGAAQERGACRRVPSRQASPPVARPVQGPLELPRKPEAHGAERKYVRC
jgi:hypothetical protein